MPRTPELPPPSSKVKFSNLQKVFFPDGKFTKGEMIKYYADVAPWLLPHLKNRPVTVIRFPDGRGGMSFYEKNAPKFTPAWLKTTKVERRHAGGSINYLLINDVSALLWCANLASIELHPFLHQTKNLDQPTSVAFDLDPGEGADLLTCIDVALLVRELMKTLGLECFPKVSGSKGLQLYVPLNTKVTYEQTSPFAKAIATRLEEKYPDLVVSKMAKELRKKKVMIDWSQNNPSKTTISVYSMRAKRDTPYVSMGVSWTELERAKKAQDSSALFFTPAAAIKRLKRLGDLFAPVLTLKQKFPKDFEKTLAEASLPPTAKPDAKPKAKPTSAKTKSALSRYEKKRDFTLTAEPSGREKEPVASGQTSSALRFVIQKHAATNLHFDFRLEQDGTMKSWAVPKGIPYETGVKRSAFEVEDHPISYMKFEGTIPKGQYGGGTVMVWDIGTYEVTKGSIEKGSVHLRLSGKKLAGDWHLFRIRNANTKPVWLITREGEAMTPLSEDRENSSVLTERTMEKIAADNDAQWKS